MALHGFSPDMDRTRDELAGVVDLFGGLTREELAQALHELAFKQGEDVNEDAVDAVIEEAITEYYLVAVDHDGERVLAPGPVAFPSLPENATDLPHILDVERRDFDRTDLGEAVRDRLEDEVEQVVEAGDADRAASLLDVTYDAETWANVDLADLRDDLADVGGG